MSRQSRLVLLLLLAIGVCQATLSSTQHSLNIVHDDVPDNMLDLNDDILPAEPAAKPEQHIRISTPKVKEVPVVASTTSAKSESSTAATTQKSIRDDILNDLVEAAKHSEALLKDERYVNDLAVSS